MINSLTTVTTFDSDLRDSNGNHIKVFQITNVDGTYDRGGMELKPEYFGMANIEYVFLQSSIVYQLDGPDNPYTYMVALAMRQIQQPDSTYKWFLVEHLNEAGAWNELPDGTSLYMPEDMCFIFCVIGA